jgi:2-phosphoglycerate kinase
MKKGDSSDAQRPPIVLIGCANGSGKSYLAVQLAARYAFDHSLGTGFIREIVRAAGPGRTRGELQGFSYAGADPVLTLRRQAEALKPAVDACLRRAYAEGTSLIIEGTHLLPSLYRAHPAVSGFVTLAVPEATEHARRLHHGHLDRDASPDMRRAIGQVEALYQVESNEMLVPHLRFDDNLIEIAHVLLGQGPADHCRVLHGSGQGVLT